MVVRENAGQHKRRIEIVADSKQKHLLTNGGNPPYARATGATGKPVQPGGFHTAGLDTTKPLAVVDVGHDAGADKVADRACDFLQRI